MVGISVEIVNIKQQKNNNTFSTFAILRCTQRSVKGGVGIKPHCIKTQTEKES